MKKESSGEYCPVSVKGVALDPTSEEPFVILQAQGEALGLNVEIGPFEASAIIIQMEGVLPPRPMTHDLLAKMFRIAKMKVLGLYIERAQDDRYFCSLVCRRGFSTQTMEIRPSDGLALALRLHFPILARRELLVSLNHPAADGRSPLSSPELFYLGPRETEAPAS